MKIICVGKIKEKYWQEAIFEYQKRLSKYTNLEIIEVADKTLADKKKNLQEEAECLKKHIKEKDWVITLEIDGDSFSSEEFAKKINDWQMKSSPIVFIIGGSDGLDESIKKRANCRLSFSKMTFPHQLFRVLLLEQIYRSYKIIHHESYHK